MIDQRNRTVFRHLNLKRFTLLSACSFAAIAMPSSAKVAEPAKDADGAFCANLMGLRGGLDSDPSLRITEARLRPAGEVDGGFGRFSQMVPVPAHCEVIGTLRPRDGANGQHYVIKFHMRLPVQWRGGFVFQGGGGSNGNLGNAIGFSGAGQRNALERGYAVVSQDSGHDNDVNVDPKLQGEVTFGHDFQARRDYAYTSQPLVTLAAKAIIRAAYGRGPEHSYFVGCSKGGQEGMMMAQRYPTYFDGILSTAPGFTLPKAAVGGQIWDSQVLAKAAASLGQFDAKGVPLLNKAFSDEDLALVSRTVLGACDDLDGARDGMVQNFRSCTTPLVSNALAQVTCKSAKNATCVTAPQVDALMQVFGGARNSRGELLYAPWPWDAGVGGRDVNGAYFQGWRQWKIGPYDSIENTSVNVTLGAAATSAVFTTPPSDVPMDNSELTRWMLAFDLSRDFQKIFVSNDQFPESAWDTMSADSLDRTQFRDHGGKLLLVHGVSDPIFSIDDTIRWLLSLDSVEGGKASEFARLFAVPGMAHCGGGPATDEYDAFQALVDWVEQHKAPEVIQATAGPNTPWPGRSRPLCRFPKVATYNGRGSLEKAENFSCV